SKQTLSGSKKLQVKKLEYLYQKRHFCSGDNIVGSFDGIGGNISVGGISGIGGTDGIGGIGGGCERRDFETRCEIQCDVVKTLLWSSYSYLS
nr:hypothetical protein [Tanacetum cinerariifolium]